MLNSSKLRKISKNFLPFIRYERRKQILFIGTCQNSNTNSKRIQKHI